VLLVLLTACGGNSGNTSDPGLGGKGPTVPLPSASLAPVGPADLSAPADTSKLTGAYTGEACAAIAPGDVALLTGLTGTVEFAVRAGTVIGTAPAASQTSCLYASLASSVGLSLPSQTAPVAEATYEAQVSQALGGCPDRATRPLTAVGLEATLVDCPAQHGRVLALKGRAFPGVGTSAATCAVLNAPAVDENRFLGFCASALRKAAS
jgi:hypothetical protein